MLTAPVSFQTNYPPYRMQAPSGRPAYPMAYSNTRQANGFAPPYFPYPPSQPVRSFSTLPGHYPPAKPTYGSPTTPGSDIFKPLLAMGALALGGMAALLCRNRSQTDHEPSGHNLVIPKEFQDPRHCDQVAYRIVDEAFPKMMELLKQYPADSREFWNGSQTIYEEALQRHVAPNVSADFGFSAGEQYQHSGETGRKYMWLDEDKGKPEQEPVFYIGHMRIDGPDPFRHFKEGPLRQRWLQNWYSTFLHETRHILQGYTDANEPDDCSLVELGQHDPLRKYEKDLAFPYDPAESMLCEGLRAEPNQYPHSTDINLYELNEVHQEKLEGYWKDLQQFWLREDFPLFDQKKKALYTEIFTHPDAKRSKLLYFRINKHFIQEMESYLTARKRMPGSTKDDAAPCDIRSMACAMYLRDLMRLYYQVNHIPPHKQHPHTKITPLELID